LASFIKRQTLAREMLCFLATCVSDIPERRSMTCQGRSKSRPLWRRKRRPGGEDQSLGQSADLKEI
jgi:hypothetical protein